MVSVETEGSNLMRRAIGDMLVLSVFLVGLGYPAVQGFTQDTTKKAGLEFSELLRMYMLPEGAGYNLIDWSTGSSVGTPIAWKHNGIAECSRFVRDTFRTVYCRAGTVQVLVDGSPTHTVLKKVIEPGRWDVTLMGARAGFFLVSISSDVISMELSSDLLEEVAKKSSGALEITSIKSCGGLTGRAELYGIKSPQKQRAVVKMGTSCGSAGCSIDLVLSPDPMTNDLQQLMAAEPAC